MKRYENPTMYISVFDAENVVTEASGITPVEKTKAIDEALNSLSAANVTETLKFTF